MSGICNLVAFAFAAAAGLLGHCAMWWLVLAMLFLGGAALKFVSERQRIGLTTAIVALLLLANRRDFISVVGVLSGKISADLGEERVTALAVRPSPEHPLLIDSWVARYLYDYRLPEGVLDLEFGAPFPGALPGTNSSPPHKGAEFCPGDIYLACSTIVGALVHYTSLDRPIPTWIPFGISTFTTERNPRHVYLIPSESCKGRRQKAG